ncbi:hypothetical protein BRADI_4g10213v3 [Brachypodium distachyon]|uniref:Uncharacterized protein n=1 Tax=Brachypodium distachyon TaxID=15368 RepID=A0A2K2CLT1_BRADI|nr:hypothetical protein BRADI_4g10213v3 [Brachypodium distachyon]
MFCWPISSCSCPALEEADESLLRRGAARERTKKRRTAVAAVAGELLPRSTITYFHFPVNFFCPIKMPMLIQ